MPCGLCTSNLPLKRYDSFFVSCKIPVYTYMFFIFCPVLFTDFTIFSGS
jgi:hypothetical protein